MSQAAEFDYGGTRAARALREDGCRVMLANGHPC
jgi:carbamoylphosphate synthase large subunit